ncbi:unnamed protein product [Mytilus edulis]|uniref:Uncharacterized protein n=1 Tax=Mytilus edulis TaxID=6550 RepID=A0A8S3T111_MYTED|nr:unnamed protein product [Mytilus edulis]
MGNYDNLNLNDHDRYKYVRYFHKNTQKVQKELRRAYWKYIENIVTPQEETQQHSNMKRFWTYIKHMKTDSSGVAPLRSDGVLHSHPVDQATILNKQFQSAFSSKETYSPEKFKSRYIFKNLIEIKRVNAICMYQYSNTHSVHLTGSTKQSTRFRLNLWDFQS